MKTKFLLMISVFVMLLSFACFAEPTVTWRSTTKTLPAAGETLAAYTASDDAVLLLAQYNTKGSLINISVKEGKSVEAQVQQGAVRAKAMAWQKDVLAPLGEAIAIDDMHVSTAFGDNMVLQRQKPVRIWGWSDVEGQTVTAEFRGNTATGVVKDGMFELYLPEMEASTTPETLVVYSENGGREEFHDVLTGDVWFGIGQSNMQGYVGAGVLPVNTSDNLRLVMSSNLVLETGQPPSNLDVTKPLAEPADYEKTRWTKPETNYVGYYSELAYTFAKDIVDATGNQVPIGVIQAAVPGTPLNYFMPTDLAKSFGYNDPKDGQNYNLYIAPYEKMTVKGILWLQGASNYNNYENYATQYKAMMETIGFDRLPIYMVEKPAIFKEADTMGMYMGLGNIRSHASTVADLLPNVQITATTDLWKDRTYWNVLHPYTRQAFAHRAAKIALAKEYGIGVIEEGQGPMVTSIRYDEANENSVIITFKHTGKALHIEGGTIKGMELYADERQATPITVVSAEQITKDKILVTGDAKPVWVRYAGEDDATYPEKITVANSYKVPAVAFAKPVSGTETVVREPWDSGEDEGEYTIYEAEDGTIYENPILADFGFPAGTVKSVTDERASGGAYVTNWLVPGSNVSLTFTVTAPSAGTYPVKLKMYTNYAVANYPDSDIPRLYVNGTGDSKTEGVTPISVSFVPQSNSFVWTDVMEVSLNEGENTLTYAGGNTLMNMGIDALYVAGLE